jgi:hypothetical protein
MARPFQVPRQGSPLRPCPKSNALFVSAVPRTRSFKGLTVEVAPFFLTVRIGLSRSRIRYLLVIVICTSLPFPNAQLGPVTHYSICHDVD